MLASNASDPASSITQIPEMHASPALHAVRHPPQFCGSLLGFTHASPMQLLSGDGQCIGVAAGHSTMRQVPETQVLPTQHGAGHVGASVMGTMSNTSGAIRSAGASVNEASDIASAESTGTAPSFRGITREAQPPRTQSSATNVRTT
jgi:hypothetical protein